MPELAHQGIFLFSRLTVNCFVKTVKNYSIYLNCTDFMRVLSVLQEHCGTHNNLMKIFSKNYTLYGVYIFLNFDIRLKDKNKCCLGSNFINLSENLVK